MRNNTDNDPRPFVLTTARLYVSRSLPKEVEVASEASGGGGCGSAPTPSQKETPGCATSGCGTTSTVQQRTSCC